MNENLKKFFDQLSTDLVLQEKIKEQPSIEGAYAVAAEAVTGFTPQEFATALDAFRRDADDKLNDDEMEKVAGGPMPPRRPYDVKHSEIV